MKKVLLLIGVVLSLIFSTPYTLIGAISIAASDEIETSYSTAQQDLDNFGLIESDYVLDSESTEQASCLLFAETKNEKNNYYYYLYIYDPKGFSIVPEICYKSIQIGYLTSNERNLVNDDEAVERALNYYDLTYLSKSDNNTVAKYIVKGLDPSTKKSNRRYQVRQVKYEKDNTISYLTLGDEYLYYDNSDGSVGYEYKKMNYITLNNVKAYSFPLENTTFLESLFPFIENEDNKMCHFYGFSVPDDYKIDNLLEVNIFYTYREWDYYSWKLSGDVYWGSNPSLLGKDYGAESPYYGKYSNIYSNEVVINQEHKSFEGQSMGIFFSKSFTLDWKTITTPKELISSTNNDDFKLFANRFKDNDYVINYLNEDFTFDKFSCAHNILDSDYKSAVKLWAVDKGSDSVYHIETNKLETVEMTKMKFQSQGKIYDLDVIVSPVTPIVTDSINPNDSWFKKLWEKLCAWIEETFDTESPLTEIIAIIIIVLSIIVGIMLLVGIVKMLLSGVVKLLLDGIIAIITFPFTLFSKKDKGINHHDPNRR